ncbi:MAG: hypothetical protein ACLSA6_10455 [Holdemania massiliensis]
MHKMVLTGAAGIRPKQSWQAKIKIAGYKAAKKAISMTGNEAMLEEFKRKSGSDDYRNATGVMRETFVKVVNDDVSDMLEDITVPVLLVWGEKRSRTALDGKQMEAKMKMLDWQFLKVMIILLILNRALGLTGVWMSFKGRLGGLTWIFYDRFRIC